MEDIKIFTKHEKELETLRQTVGIFSQHIGMEFGFQTASHTAYHH